MVSYGNIHIGQPLLFFVLVRHPYSLRWIPLQIWKGCHHSGDNLAAGQVSRECLALPPYPSYTRTVSKKDILPQRQLSRSTAGVFS